MPLSYILQQVGYKMGLSPQDSSQRAVILRFIQEGCDELYAQADIEGSLVEQCFKVNGDQTISMPAHVGEIRGIRELNSHIAVSLQKMRPRYAVNNWPDTWRNWRLKSKQALMQSVVNEGPVTIECAAVENPPVSVTIGGSTTTAQRVTETVVMDEVSKATVLSFTDIDSITKTGVTQHDYNIYDLDGLGLSVIPNDQLEAVYTIVDISMFPWSKQGPAADENFLEVLYKKPLPQMTNDGDEFPAKGYDNIIVNKALQLWQEETGEVDKALAYDKKAERSLARKHENVNRATEDTVQLVPHPHDQLLNRISPRSVRLTRPI